MMQNPFGPQQDPGLYSYINLQARVLKNIRASGVQDQIFQAVREAYEEALKKENVPLIQLEKKRMLAQVMKEVLTDMLEKLDGGARA